MASIRNFLISFLLSLTLFSVMAYFGIGTVVDLVTKSSESEQDNGAENDLGQLTSDATGVLNLLLIGTDEYHYESSTPSTGNWIVNSFGEMVDVDRKNYEKTIVFMTLVSFNSYRQQVTVTAFPTEMTVAANDWELDLDSAYYFSDKELYGLDKDYFVQSISATIGMQIDYSASIDIDDYVQVADNLGGLSVNCPEGDEAAGIEAGKATLTSAQLRALLAKADYADPASRTQLMTNVTTAALDRICSTAYYVNAFHEFDRIKYLLKDSEFDQAALTQWRSLIFSYKFYTLHKLSPIGTYETEQGETVFKIDRSGTVNYYKQYMPNDQT